MVQLAFLPETNELKTLLGGLQAAPGASVAVRPASLLQSLQTSPPPPASPSPARLASSPPRPAPLPPLATALPALPKISMPAGTDIDPRGALDELQRALSDSRTLDARFACLASWLEAWTCANAVFVVDADGLALVESGVDDAYMATGAVIDSLRKDLATLIPGVERGNTSLRTATGSCVELIWSDTKLGRLTVGLVLDEPAESIWITAILTALSNVVGP